MWTVEGVDTDVRWIEKAAASAVIQDYAEVVGFEVFAEQETFFGQI